MASDQNIASRVRAAAQLVLQDLDPEARKRRQEFMSGVVCWILWSILSEKYLANARVCLCIHAKKVRSFNKAFFNTSSFAGVQDFMFYVKMSVGETSKVTRPTEVRKDSEKNQRKSKQRKTTVAANVSSPPNYILGVYPQFRTKNTSPILPMVRQKL